MSESTVGEVLSVQSRKGTKREYETVIILRPNVNKNGILELVHKMQSVFEKYGARLLKIENWGSRTLAFPIRRQATGIYLYWRFLGGSDIVQEFERNLQIAESVLRYYTVRVEDDVDPEARPSEITEDLLQAVAEPPPEPEPVPEPPREEESRFVTDDDDDDEVRRR